MLCWCHLSDLHYKMDETYNQSVVLGALWKDLTNFRENGFKFDFIVFTGDIAFHGATDEYQAAQDDFFDKLLEITAVDKKRLFIVPGNHDSSRDEVRILTNPLTELTDADKISVFFQNKTNEKMYGASQDNFFNFLEKITGEKQTTRSWMRKPITKEGKTISLIGLNSAWFSNYHKDDSGKEDDQRKLVIGEINLIKAIKASIGSDITIAAFHHPTDWLLDFDRKLIESHLIEHCDLVLHGHLHEPNVKITANTQGLLTTIPAGAVFVKRRWPNSYNIVTLDLETKRGTVYLRRYNEKRREWIKDIDSTGEEADGQQPISLLKETLSRHRERFRLQNNYQIHFSDICIADLEKININKLDLISLVEREFRSHKTHYNYDLEDLAIPIQGGYVVFLDKIERNLTFNRVCHAADNHEKMAQWEDYLADYRMATKLSYRREPEKLLTTASMFTTAKELHKKILNKIISFFEGFEGLIVDPSKRLASRKYIEKERSDPMKVSNPFQQNEDFLNMVALMKNEPPEKTHLADTIASHIGLSVNALNHAAETHHMIRQELIHIEDGLKDMVVYLETSLQHIHKIVNYIPGN